MAQTPSPTTIASARAYERLGATISDRWRLESVLGVGGMGAVYEARHRNGKRIAIKILHPELAPNGDMLRRFQREGHLANAVEHPGAVSVLDDGVTHDGLPFLVMELLEGESLEARLERLERPLQLADALSVGVAMLEVLEAAHSKGIIHRDLKPENVFLTGKGDVKLLDFGIAFLLDTMDGSGMATTRSGLMVGTPTFMPREQAQGRTKLVDGQSDVWSTGATIFYALTQSFLYDVSTVSDFVDRLMTEPPRTIRSLRPEVPEPIAAVLGRALEHDRSVRWKTAAAMREALVAAAAEAGVQIPAKPSLDGYAPPVPLRNSLPGILDSMAPASLDGQRHAARRSSPESVTLDAIPTPVSQPPPSNSMVNSAPGMAVREPPPAPARPARSAWLLLLGVLIVGGLAFQFAPRTQPPPADSAHRAAVQPPSAAPAQAPAPPEPAATATAQPSASASAQPPAAPPRPSGLRPLASAPAKASAAPGAPATTAAATAAPPAAAPKAPGGDDLGLSRD